MKSLQEKAALEEHSVCFDCLQESQCTKWYLNANGVRVDTKQVSVTAQYTQADSQSQETSFQEPEIDADLIDQLLAKETSLQCTQGALIDQEIKQLNRPGVACQPNSSN